MKVRLLVILLMMSVVLLKAQCGCLEDIFKNDSDGNSKQIVKLFDNGFFTEGPAVDSAGNVYFSDLTFTSETGNEPGHIWQYSPITKKTKIYRSPSNMSNGMVIKNNELFICEGADTGGRRIIKTNLATWKSVILADKYNSKLFNSPNDITISDNGTIYFSDPRYAGDEKIEQPANGVYRILPTGKVELVINNITMPNGVAVNPDNTKLYVGCNQEIESNKENMLNGNFIAEYFIKPNGDVVFNKYIAKFLPPTGPDGIKLGEDGNIYAALRDDYRPGIYVYSTEGILINKIIMPEVPSNLVFSNEDPNIIYVTAGGSLYLVKLEKE